MRDKILLVLHTPPPYGGGEIQALALKNHFISQPRYLIFDYGRKSLTRTTQGMFGLKNISFGVYWILSVSYLLIRHRPAKIYFTLPKGYFAFLRNAAIIVVSKLFRVKILGELPGTSFLFLDHPGSFRYRTGLFFLRKVDEIRFLGDSIVKMHQPYNFKNPVVIDNGIYIPEVSTVDPGVFHQPELRLLYIGSIEFSKGIFNTVKALRISAEQHLDIRFEVVGTWQNSTEQKEVEDYIQANKLSDRITFHGLKLDKEKWDIISKCAILVHPTYWDGVPLSILEAFAAGLCVISTPIGGIPDIMVQGINGTILKENTPEALFDALKHYFSNRSELEQISTINKKHYFDRFTIDKFLSNMKIWYESEN